VERKSLSQYYSVNKRAPLQSPSQTDRSGREVAFELTKEAVWMVVLLSSLALWAAIWAGAASLASAWLQ
jgi:hypothetical protein